MTGSLYNELTLALLSILLCCSESQASDISFSSDVSESVSLSESIQGDSIYPGLHYTLIETTLDDEQRIDFTFTRCPTIDPRESNKEQRRKPLTDALATTWKVLEDYPDRTISLLIRSRDRSDTEEKHRVADLVKDSDYHTATFRKAMPRKMPTNVSDMLGYGAIRTVGTDDSFFLRELLLILRPRKLVFRISTPQNDPERFLIPSTKVPLVPAGVKIFRNRKHAIDTLEVGPLIPISRDCGTEYHFIFAEWRIKTLMIDCQNVIVASNNTSPEGSSAITVASILFDPDYGFVRMMAGMQSDQEGRTESGTQIVLMMKNKNCLEDFRHHIEFLSGQQESKSSARLNYAANPAYRLELFQRKMFYLLESKVTPRPIWSTAKA